jgi:ATP-dependent DNA helicase RecG
MTSQDLAEVLGTVESATLEFKESAKSERTRQKIGQSICAFANDLVGADGGDLLIGVGDGGEPVSNLDCSDRALLQLTDFRDDGRILDRPNLTVEPAVYKGVPVIRMHVAASAAPPIRFENIVYVRPGPTTRRAHADDERVLAERRRAKDVTFDLRTRPSATLDQLNLELFKNDYLPSVVSREVIEENGRPLAQQLSSLHVTDPAGTPTTLGVLVVGYDSREYIPGSYVQFVRYAGTDRTADIADDKELSGNIISVARDLEPLIRANVRVAVGSDGSVLSEERRPDYPLQAIREAVMNALMHRDYELSNAPTQIDWYDDRVQISNPGGPYGRVTSENFGTVNGYRNSSLAAAMKHLGLVNRFGRGIARIRASMQANGNPRPEFLVNDAYWAVILEAVA